MVSSLLLKSYLKWKIKYQKLIFASKLYRYGSEKPFLLSLKSGANPTKLFTSCLTCVKFVCFLLLSSCKKHFFVHYKRSILTMRIKNALKTKVWSNWLYEMAKNLNKWKKGKKRGLENDWAISAFLQFLRSSGKLAIVRNFHWKEKKWILRALWGRNVWFLYDGMFVHASFQEKVRVCFICLCVCS